MMPDDDWRGEHLIPVGKLSEHKRRSTNMQVVSSVVAERRRRAGIPPNGRAQHDAFVRSLHGTQRKIDRIHDEVTR